jgi:beta-lactamase regulating signal transducer with metallopeptidase domain/TolA-binding protein
VDTLLHAAVANALTATLLALPVALAARVCRRPALAHALWLLVLLKLITPPLFPVRLPWADPLAAAPEQAEDPIPAAATRRLPVRLAPPASDLPAAGALPPAADAVHIPHQPLAPWPAEGWAGWKGLLLTAWLAGSVLWWALACVRVARFRRVLRHARTASPELVARVRRLAGRLGLPRCPGVWLVPARVSPLLWALGWTPRLLLPADLWDSLTPDQRDALLAHELAHLRRRDHWVRRLELLVLGLFWWHPVAWWARRELAEAEEACCDAWVVWALPEAGPSYAAALVATATFLSESRRPVPVAASGAGRVQTLKRRLTMILQRPCPRALSGVGLLTVLGLGALLLPLLPTWAGQDPDGPRAGQAVPPAARPATDQPGTAVPPAAAKEVPGKPAGESGNPPALADQVEKLRDEVELLEAQLAVKRVQLQAAQAALRYAEQVLGRLAQLGGAVSQVEIERARADKAAREAHVQVAQAQMREPEVRLAQARRRLAALQGRSDAPAKPASGGGWAEQLFDTRVLDVRVLPSEKVTGRIHLTNRTKEPVRISSVRTSSSALTANPSSTALAPGSKNFIDFTVDGRRFTGAKVFTLYVAFDRPAAAKVQVQVRAVVAGSGDRPGPEGAGDGKASDDRARLQRLEKQLEMLRKEVESLRKTLPQRPPAGDRPAGGGPLRINSRTFVSPFQFAEGRSRDIRCAQRL